MKSDNTGYTIVRFNLITSLLTVLNENDEGSTDFVLAKYMVEHIDELGKLSIYKIADDCFLSRSSVQRFIKTVGYDSFADLKHAMPLMTRHQRSFLAYTDHADYADYLSHRLRKMTKDINETCRERDLEAFARRIHDARDVVVLVAEDSSSAVRFFQQAMLAQGRLIRLVTSSTTTLMPLSKLGADDLLVTASVSGNFALAVDRQIRGFNAKKCLITLNRTMLFEQAYEHIYYLSDRHQASRQDILEQRDVYTNYALQYFFDLLFHTYYQLFG